MVMACTTFHPFSELPVELRLQIWQEACILSQHGLHYFILDQNRQLAVPNFNWGYLKNRQVRSNRSAYLQSLGLWTACKESRSIISEAWNIPKWRRDLWWSETYYELMFEDTNTTPAPAMIDIPGGHEPWHVTVRPTQDMFCITAENWEPLIRNWRWISFTANFLGNKAYALPVHYIALEYDPSWNRLLYCREEERPYSSLAFLIRMLYDLSREPFPKHVRLLDKTARWIVQPGDDLQTVFCDCDHEYVEIDYEYRSERDPGLINESPLFDFMDQLDYDLTDRRDWERISHLNANLSETSIGLPVKTLITLLLRRDNQVTK